MTARPNPIPNILTGVRLIAGVVMFLMLAGAMGGVPILSAYLSPADQFALQRMAFVIFVVAASTDWVDGWLARRWHAESRWGAILDPIADKVLVATSLVLLVLSGTLPAWLLVAALMRDAAVGGLGLASKLRGRWLEVAPTRISKYATFTVMLTVFLALGHRAGLGAAEILPYLRVIAILAAQCLIVASLQYAVRWRDLLRA